MAEESCSIYSKSADWWVRGQSFYGGATRRSPGDVSAKFLRALDVQTGKIAGKSRASAAASWPAA